MVSFQQSRLSKKNMVTLDKVNKFVNLGHLLTTDGMSEDDIEKIVKALYNVNRALRVFAGIGQNMSKIGVPGC